MFDAAVGNPPYQKAESDAKRWTLWAEFVVRTLTLTDRLTFVTPSSVLSPALFHLIKDYAVIINLNVGHYFTVGSTFSYFILDKNKYNNYTQILSNKNIYELNLKDYSFLPMYMDDDTFKDLDWLANRTKRKWTRGELHTSNKDLFIDDGLYDVIHTNAQIKKTNIIHKNYAKIRVCVTLSGYPKFQVIQNAYCSQATLWTEFDNMTDATTFANECNGVEVQRILQTFKWSGWNSKEVIEAL